MHKIFAKTLFLGKKVVFLPHCHSTNEEMATLIKSLKEPEGLVLYTENQLRGKGQRGNVWVSEPKKNILTSILLRPGFLEAKNQFLLNLVAGLAIVDVITPYLKAPVALKWPNDVYVDDRKIAGVLIETNLRGNSLESAIIGIGLNVNQQAFHIPVATSLAMETGNRFDLRQILEDLLVKLEKWYLLLKSGKRDAIVSAYHDRMLWRGETHVFQSGDERFQGEIVGIDSYGQLAINRGGHLQKYGIKEVSFIA